MSQKTVKLALAIEYKGCAYSGWQIQPNQKTIEGTLEDALRIFTGRFTKVRGCSRTDAGVHARGQLAVITVDSRFSPQQVQKSLNGLTPEDISVNACSAVPDDYHLPADVKAKRYIYQMHCGCFPPAIEKDFYWWLKKLPDINAMQEAAKLMIGKKDFSAFRASNCTSDSTIKEIFSIDIEQVPYGQASRIYIKVIGDGFLKNMVRIMTGTLADIGLGRIQASAIEEALNTGRRELLGMTAPPGGLSLDKVFTRTQIFKDIAV